MERIRKEVDSINKLRDVKWLTKFLISLSETKCRSNWCRLFVLGFLGGISIGLGGVGYLTLASSGTQIGKFLGSSMFPVGLMIIIFLGLELFTSNTMIFIGKLDNKVSLLEIGYNLITVYFANLLGTLFVAYITSVVSTLNKDSLQLLEIIVVSKSNTLWYSLFLKGILCNILVCVAVCIAFLSKEVVGKIFGVWFPICLFVLLGYEHCIANMFYYSLALIEGTEITIVDFVYNLLFSTLGNITGGALFIGGSLFYCNKE